MYDKVFKELRKQRQHFSKIAEISKSFKQLKFGFSNETFSETQVEQDVFWISA